MSRTERRCGTKRWTAAAAVALVVVALTACGKSKTAQGEKGSTQGVTKDAIHVTGVAPLTSARGTATQDVQIGAKARFARANKTGIHGRKIVLDGMEDNGDDSTKGAQAYQKVVQADKPFAIVPVYDVVFGGAAVLKQSGIPLIGATIDPRACGIHNLFAIWGCLTPPTDKKIFSPAPGRILADGAFGGHPKGRSVVVTHDDSPVGHNSVTTCDGPLQKAGFKDVSKGKIFLPANTTITDYSPYVQKVMSADHGKPPDVVFICNAFGPTLGLTSALKAAGYKGTLYNSITYDPRLMASKQTAESLEDSYVAVLLGPAESDNAAIRQLKADVKAVDPKAPLTLTLMMGYWSADMFVKMLQATGKNLNRTTFLDTARKFSYRVPGGVCGAKFPQGFDEPTPGDALVQVKNGKYKVAEPLTCYPQSSLVHY